MAYMSEDELRKARKKLTEDFGESKHEEDTGSHLVGVIGMAAIGLAIWTFFDAIQDL